MALGGQDCHANASGAHTGDISAPMLADAGASHVIVGHSERRSDHAETSPQVQAKATAALAAGLTPIICCGEPLDIRTVGNALPTVERELAASLPNSANIVVAYEPIWAIGTGVVATTDQISEMHDTIRTLLVGRYGADAGGNISILYGGSVNADNAADIFALSNVNGGLVGGASLSAEKFVPVMRALAASYTFC